MPRFEPAADLLLLGAQPRVLVLLVGVHSAAEDHHRVEHPVRRRAAAPASTPRPRHADRPRRRRRRSRHPPGARRTGPSRRGYWHSWVARSSWPSRWPPLPQRARRPPTRGPTTIPALREWEGGEGTFQLRRGSRIVVPRARRRKLRSEAPPAGVRSRRADGPPPTGRRLAPPAAAAGRHPAGARGPSARARGRGLPPADRRSGEDRRAAPCGRVLRDPHAPPAAPPGPAASARPGARLAALPRAGADGGRRPQVLHPRLAALPRARARLAQAQLPASAPERQPGLPHREREPSGDRLGAPSHEGRGPVADRAGAAPPHHRRAGDRHAGPHGGRARPTPRAPAQKRGGNAQPRQPRLHAPGGARVRGRAGGRSTCRCSPAPTGTWAPTST